jgi:hypothetical protein
MSLGVKKDDFVYASFYCFALRWRISKELHHKDIQQIQLTSSLPNPVKLQLNLIPFRAYVCIQAQTIP